MCGRTGCGLRLRYAVARRGRQGWRLELKGLPQGYGGATEESPRAGVEDYYRLAVMRRAAGGIEAALAPDARR